MKDHRTYEVLYELYINQKRDMYEIGDLFGIRGGSVRYWLIKLNIPIRSYSEAFNLSYKNGDRRKITSRKGKFKPEYKELLKKLYLDEKKTSGEIGIILGVGQGTASRWIRESGIKPRTLVEAGKLSYKRGKVAWNKGTVGVMKVRSPSIEERRISSIKAIARHEKIDRPFKHKDILEKLYIKDGLSSDEVGERLGCSRGAVLRWLRKFNLPVRGKVLYGENHGNWKGGLTSRDRLERTKFTQSKLPIRCFERDDYTCQICTKRGCELNAHHIYNFSLYIPLRFNLDNLITLCVDCHFKVHGKKRKQKETEMSLHPPVKKIKKPKKPIVKK